MLFEHHLLLGAGTLRRFKSCAMRRQPSPLAFGVTLQRMPWLAKEDRWAGGGSHTALRDQSPFVSSFGSGILARSLSSSVSLTEQPACRALFTVCHALA